ncbi:MAG: phosphoribosylglycinamide formyltransferase [Pseudomonadales bacterium]|jgi:phosphoribosylglycinamide formyltransferase-1|nr:phosphoribosylglycinamide formyltransferase [Pseudomonadales bacterium]
MPRRLAVLLSGRGSNLEALVESVHECPAVDARIVGVCSNRPRAPGLEIARAAGIASTCVDHRAYADRSAFEADLGAALDRFEPDLLVLAGFMRVLTPAFVRRYSPRMLNIHPSLLPDLPGLHTHARALERGDPEAGASVHVVTPEVDGGPVVARVRVPVAADDTPERLEARVRAAEHRLYPAVLAWEAAGRLQLGTEAVRLDEALLPATGIDFRLRDEVLEPC